MYILSKAKQDRQTKTFEIRSLCYRLMAAAWGESRFDETCIKNLHIVVLQTLQMKKRSIGKYSSMIWEYFDMLRCEFGAWISDYERGQNSLLNLA